MDKADQDEKETVGKRNEGSLGGLKSKASPYAIPDEQNNLKPTVKVFPDLKYSTAGSENASKRETSLYSHENNYRPFYHHEFSLWPNLEQSNWVTMENPFYPIPQAYPYPLDNRVQYFPLRTCFPGYPQVFNAQEFQYFVVVDFEATCDKENNPHPQEIIEFPSVLVNSMTGQLEASFQTYVRPAYHQNLTDFCKELTGIQQTQVDRGVPLGEALFMHDKWLEDKGIKHTNFAIVTWSSWDCRVMLESECRFKRIKKPHYFNRWINLKIPFQEFFGGTRCNLKEAVQLAGLVWEGRAHCGLDDARNTARLLALLMRRGSRLAITDSLSSAAQPQTILLPHAAPFHPVAEPRVHCFCGVTSSKRMVRKPGPKHGRFFFGCGNWTTARGAVCPYFEWDPAS